MNSNSIARERFLQCWGEMGSSWGINKTMAQIHALLMVSERPLNMDEIMTELDASRGNVHLNLRQLMDWGLITRTYQRGDRKDYFQSEKGVWKMFCAITRERKRREIEPVLRGLEECVRLARQEKNATALQKQMEELLELSRTIDFLMGQIATQEDSRILPLMMKLVGGNRLPKSRK